MPLKPPLITTCPYCRSSGRVSGEIPQEGITMSCPTCRGTFVVHPGGRVTTRRRGEPKGDPPRRYDDRHLLFARQLEVELGTWVKEGIVTPDQQERILDRYVALRQPARRSERLRRLRESGITIGIALSIILFTVGVVIHSGRLERGGRFLFLGCATLLLEGVGIFFRMRGGRFHDPGSLTVLLGSLCYGLLLHDVTLLADVPLRGPLWLLFWSVGVIPLAMAVSSRSLLFLSLLVPVAYPLVGGAGDSLSVDLILQSTASGVVGLILLGIASLLRSGRVAPLADTWEDVGNGAVLLSLVPLTLPFCYRHGFPIPLPLLSLFALLVTIAGAVAAFRRRERLWTHRAAATLLFLPLFGAVGMLPPLTGLLLALVTVAGNLLFALVLLLAFNLAFVRGSVTLVNSGVVAILFYLMAHYWALLGPVLSDGVFFGLGGGMLIGAGIFLERKRKVILSHLEGGG